MRPGRAADHSPPSSATVMEEYRYISEHPLGVTGPVTGTLYLTIVCVLNTSKSSFGYVSVHRLRVISFVIISDEIQSTGLVVTTDTCLNK